MGDRGVVLFGHGARDPEWARPLQAIRAAMQAQRPELPVELAYLEFLTPDLVEAIAALAARGVREVTLVPLFLARSGHTKRDLPGLLERACARCPDLRVRVADPVGEVPEIVAAMAAYALHAAAAPARD